MQISDFKTIVATFADPGSEILYEGASVVLSVNGDLITAVLSTDSGDVYVSESGQKQPASKWILTRLAKLPLLAARLRDTISQTEFFVSPAATILPTLMVTGTESLVETADALTTAVGTINSRSPLETMVLYITSDAGEGKTSLINQIAFEQAERVLANESDWLLVPISLGGRHFLRFDDITVGALQNRYRFPFLYYNSFLALVKMGVIVPAFDGFEEMFVESSSGEALSAMGILVGSLDSKGAILVAARKAYFEFENLRTQEKLFDTIRSFSVGFGKLELARWGKDQVIRYCEKRGVTNSEELYRKVSERLTGAHPLLTRAVLVKRLIDVAEQSSSLDGLLEKIQQSGADFFSVFVRSIIEREANDKWLDRSGEKDVGTPLLSVDEHCDLLSSVALAMWEARVDYLKRDYLEFVSDFFSESNRKSAFQAQQLRQRIRGHAMLIPSANASEAVEFDHDEFRLFFLGEGIARQVGPLSDRARAEVLATLRRGVLPQQAIDALLRAIERNSSLDRLQVAMFILDICGMDAQASYTQENCSEIVLRLLNRVACNGLDIKAVAFGLDALRDRKLQGLAFADCYFSSTSLENTELENCVFSNCSFGPVRVFASTRLTNVRLNNCVVDALVLPGREREFWAPIEIREQLGRLGVQVNDSLLPFQEPLEAMSESDDQIGDVEKVIRYYMRSTHMSESIMKMKLGGRGQPFIDATLPELVKHGVLVEIENRGAGDQRRFRLGVSLKKLNASLAKAKGSFSDFISEVRSER